QYFLIFACTETGSRNVDDCIGTTNSIGKILILIGNDYIIGAKHSQCFSSILSFCNSHSFMAFCRKLLENMLTHAFTAPKNRHLPPLPSPLNPSTFLVAAIQFY